MIVKHTRFNGIKIRESLILPRLISVLKGVKVTLVLSNGTKVTGILESYGKDIKTISINSALNELHVSGKIFGDLEDVLSENEDLKNLYKAYKNKNKNNTNNQNQKIISNYKSIIKLNNSDVEFNGQILQFQSVVVPESHILTLVPETSITYNYYNNNKLGKLNDGLYDIPKMIINQHKKELKNKAFIKCSRIGNNNIKN